MAVMSRERDLVDAAAGSAVAFDALIAPLLDPAFRLAMVMLGEHADAEDAVQEAALKCWGRLRQFHGEGGAFRAWFLSIVANECRMARRRPWWSVLRSGDGPPLAVDSAEDAAIDNLDLRRALAQLPPEDRLALFAHFYLELPLAESARVLGVPLGTAKSRIYRAARRLRPGVALTEVIG
ncbi:MAG: sigma-70 family RNA polymerase sigma factor [Candidatus Dormibacteraceae bacterium]